MATVAHPVMASDDLMDMSLAELSDITVTSVSKRNEKQSQVAAAIHVITQEDIRRSGATSIVEALRLAPGVQVARAGAHEWAVTARGFNGQFANKLLVLIDGRTVYTPLFSGVFWDVQDTLLEDIDRIEVIRGPGGTIWGANAVNGVINIITKNADDTQGDLARVQGGSLDDSMAYRHGGKTGDTAYRFFGQAADHEELRTLTGRGSDDDWNQVRTGVRTDTRVDGKNTVLVQAEAYQGDEDTNLFIPRRSPPFNSLVEDEFGVHGGHVTSRWDATTEKGQASVQAYYDFTSRDTFAFSSDIHILDIDYNQSRQIHDRHEITWGTGYRFTFSDVEGTDLILFDPAISRDNLFTAFIQDKIALSPESVFLTLGSKFEHNDYSGYEVQPSARLSWLVDESQTVWAAVSRAVRTPSIGQHNQSIAIAAAPVAGFPAVIRQVGDTSTGAEELTAYEAGYRIQVNPSASIDLATFYNDYSTLASDRPAAPFISNDNLFGPGITVPLVGGTDASGTTYGAELAGTFAVSKAWDLTASYSVLQLELTGGSTFVSAEDSSPQHQFSIQSHYDFTDALSMDNIVYYVDQLRLGASDIPAYTRFDTQLSWIALDGLRLSLVGQNLLDDRHQEFGGFLYNQPAEIPRSIYGKAVWQF